MISTTGKRYLKLSYKSTHESVDFYINPPYDKTFYVFNQSTNISPFIVDPKDYSAFIKTYPDLTPREYYITNTIDTGRIDFIEFDTSAKKIKARLSFTGKETRTGNKITVTDGYFEYHRL